jgi:hypothetical protein
LSSCTIGGFSRRAQLHEVSLVSYIQGETMSLEITHLLSNESGNASDKIFMISKGTSNRLFVKFRFVQDIEVSLTFRKQNFSISFPQEMYGRSVRIQKP